MARHSVTASADAILLPGLFGDARDTYTAGVDEAGRGCLAGPVVAAAVILPEKYDLPGMTDSKAISEKRREELAPLIRACAVAWGLGVVWPQEIDRCNILQATFRAMSRALSCLKMPPAQALIDGNKTIPTDVLGFFWRKERSAFPLPRQEAIVKGDARVPAISAASILAKTFRDSVMRAMDRRWPGYGFAVHKGYGTSEHIAMLELKGPCPQHRMTFAKVRPPEQPKTAQAALWP